MTAPSVTADMRERDDAKLPYPPPWQDISTLCKHICLSHATVEHWVKQGLLPPPKLRGGKRMWKWKDVDRYLEEGGPNVAPSADTEAERVRDAARKAIADARQ